jgi:hypothetical protein
MKPAFAVGTLVLLLPLAACGGDAAAVCTSVDDLKDSVADVKDIDVTASGGLAELETALRTVESDFGVVKADAKSEFSSGIDATETSYAALRTSVEAAVASASAATLVAAGTALSAFATDVRALIDDVEATC